MNIHFFFKFPTFSLFVQNGIFAQWFLGPLCACTVCTPFFISSNLSTDFTKMFDNTPKSCRIICDFFPPGILSPMVELLRLFKISSHLTMPRLLLPSLNCSYPSSSHADSSERGCLQSFSHFVKLFRSLSLVSQTVKFYRPLSYS